MIIIQKRFKYSACLEKEIDRQREREEIKAKKVRFRILLGSLAASDESIWEPVVDRIGKESKKRGKREREREESRGERGEMSTSIWRT